MMVSRFLPSSQISGRMYNTMVQLSVYDVKSVSQPDTMPILENNYCLQIIGNWVAEQF
jgi:hypothetical protein